MPTRTVPEWEELARLVILDMLEQLHAVTINEMEARASDRTWNPAVAPTVINPHHLTTARSHLEDEGLIATTAFLSNAHHPLLYSLFTTI